MKTKINKGLRLLSKIIFPKGAEKMVRINLTKVMVMTALVFMCSSFLYASNSYALFEDLAKHGGKIFMSLREIIYAVSGFGIIAIVIGSIFGSINYKWLTAIIIGLFVIAATASLINYMVGSTEIKATTIQDTIVTGRSAS